MKTPREKYLHDHSYRTLVDLLEAQIQRAEFTPSEVREAAMMACINYEMRRLHPCTIADPTVLTALETIEKFSTTRAP